jgi:hypothetical protein
MVKNFMADNGGFDKRVTVPLILGIWGGKGMGKTFQTELTFKKMGWAPPLTSIGVHCCQSMDPHKHLRPAGRNAQACPDCTRSWVVCRMVTSTIHRCG